MAENEDVKFGDAIEEEDETSGIPQEERHLSTQAYDKAVSDLVAMINNGDMLLDPDYQRNYVWSDDKASLLVESILLNVPIPVVYVSEEDDGKWSVVDGLQRLHSLHRFFDNGFKLRKLDVLVELNGQHYRDLNGKAARLLRNGIIRVIVITKESHPEIKYDIFMRLNRGAQRLTEQELRNCLYRGPLNKLLHELRKEKDFMLLLGRSVPDKRMADGEVILRYFMVSSGYDPDTGVVLNYSGNMKSSLNKFMKLHQRASPKVIEDFREEFRDNISKVRAVFGAAAFRRPLMGAFDERPNRAIMEAQMVAFKPYLLSAVRDSKNALLRAFMALEKDTAFDDAVTIRTSNKSQLNYRVHAWSSKVKSILG